MSQRDHAEELFAIAELVDGFTIKRMDPERFHVVRDELSKRIRRLAGRIRADGRPAPTTTWRSS